MKALIWFGGFLVYGFLSGPVESLFGGNPLRMGTVTWILVGLTLKVVLWLSDAYDYEHGKGKYAVRKKQALNDMEEGQAPGTWTQEVQNTEGIGKPSVLSRVLTGINVLMVVLFIVSFFLPSPEEWKYRDTQSIQGTSVPTAEPTPRRLSLDHITPNQPLFYSWNDQETFHYDRDCSAMVRGNVIPIIYSMTVEKHMKPCPVCLIIQEQTEE